MNLSGSMILPSSAVHVQQSTHNGQNGAWQRQFSNQVAQSSTQKNPQYDLRSREQAFGQGFVPQRQRLGAPPMDFQIQQPQYHQPQASGEVFDEDAFARAFEEAESWQIPTEQAEHEQAISDTNWQTPLADWELELDQAVRDSEREKEQKAHEEFELRQETSHPQTFSSNTLETPDPFQPTKRLGADLIINPITDLPPDQRPHTNPNEDNDALARTAGHLLDSVSDNTDLKFQNSQFLRLMQQFRDREVAVRGDKIVMNGMDSINGNGVLLDDGNSGRLGGEIGVVSS